MRPSDALSRQTICHEGVLTAFAPFMAPPSCFEFSEGPRSVPSPSCARRDSRQRAANFSELCVRRLAVRRMRRGYKVVARVSNPCLGKYSRCMGSFVGLRTSSDPCHTTIEFPRAESTPEYRASAVVASDQYPPPRGASFLFPSLLRYSGASCASDRKQFS